MATIKFTSTKATPGSASTPQALIWRIYQKIGDIGVLVLPNGNEIKGGQLRACAFPDFCAAKWSALAGEVDWESFVAFMADLARALEAYRGTTNRQLFRIPAACAPSLAPSGYAAGGVYEIDVEAPAPYTGMPSSIVPRVRAAGGPTAPQPASAVAMPAAVAAGRREENIGERQSAPSSRDPNCG
jgi:hypothetical protein